MVSSLRFFLPVCLCVLFFSCKKEGPLFPVTPSIEAASLSVTPLTAKNLSNKITIKFTFTDGDGDIGSDTYPPNEYLKIYALPPDTTVDSVLYKYSVPDLSVSGNNKSIKGEMEVIVQALGWSPFQLQLPAKTKLLITLEDRSGKISTPVYTPEITLTN